MQIDVSVCDCQQFVLIDLIFSSIMTLFVADLLAVLWWTYVDNKLHVLSQISKNNGMALSVHIKDTTDFVAYMDFHEENKNSVVIS